MVHLLIVFFVLETNDLEKVTVKSLDEIKREKEQRLKESAASAITSLATPASQTTNGGVSEGAGKGKT